MEQKLDNVDPYPYTLSDYLKRFLWSLIQSTIWKILPHRIPSLRMIVLKTFGANVQISSMAFGSTSIFRPWEFSIGKLCTLGPRVRVYNLSKISIGDNTVISQDTYLCGGTHDYSKSNLPLIRQNITIGNSVWICAGAFIGPGVTIGEGAVVGARAVVTSNVEPWTVVAGNPAILIKKRII